MPTSLAKSLSARGPENGVTDEQWASLGAGPGRKLTTRGWSGAAWPVCCRYSTEEVGASVNADVREPLCANMSRDTSNERAVVAASRDSVRARLGSVAVMVALVGCAAPEPADQPLATYAPGTGPSAMDALFTGTVDLIDGCLVIRDETTDELVVPIFADRDVEWDGAALTYQGRRHEVGDSITIGGGFINTTVAEATNLTDSLMIPDECAAEWGIWAAAGRTG